jgi:DNA-binding transcriptional LysR family regulator
VREQGSGTRMLSDWLLTTAGVSPPVGMEFSSNETIKQAVIADLGIALISAHTVGAEFDDGRLIALDVTGTPIVRQWYVVRRRALTLSAAGREMWTFLVSRGREFFPAVR